MSNIQDENYNILKAFDQDQVTMFNEWREVLPRGYLGKEGSYRFKFVIVPTSVGDEITVIDLIFGAELDLSMAEKW